MAALPQSIIDEMERMYFDVDVNGQSRYSLHEMARVLTKSLNKNIKNGTKKKISVNGVRYYESKLGWRERKAQLLNTMLENSRRANEVNTELADQTLRYGVQVLSERAHIMRKRQDELDQGIDFQIKAYLSIKFGKEDKFKEVYGQDAKGVAFTDNQIIALNAQTLHSLESIEKMAKIDEGLDIMKEMSRHPRVVHEEQELVQIYPDMNKILKLEGKKTG